MTLPGLPEGVEALRVGQAKLGEFVYIAGVIYGPASETRAYAGLVVAPAEGYEFGYDILHDASIPVKRYDRPKVLQAAFVLTTAPQEQKLRQLLANCPGLQSIEEVSPEAKDGSIITIDEKGNIDPPSAKPLIAGIARLRQH